MKLGRPQGCVRESVQEAPDERARVLVILRRQRQPLGQESVRVQALAGQGIEVAGVEVDHAGCGRARRFESDEVVAVGAAQELAAAVGQAQCHSGIGSDAVVSPEIRRRTDDGGQQLRDDTTIERVVGEQAPAVIPVPNPMTSAERGSPR